MRDNSPIRDPQQVWQGQPAEAFRVTADSLRSSARRHQSRALAEARLSMIVGLGCAVFFAWTFTRAHTTLARAGWALLSVWGVYAAFYAHRWVRPEYLPDDAPITTSLEFYRRELQKRADHLRHRWRRSGFPFLLLGMAMVTVGTGAPNAHRDPLVSSLPFLIVLVIWMVTYLSMRRKLGRENVLEDLEELGRFERENPSR